MIALKVGSGGMGEGTGRVRLAVDVAVNAPAEQVWAALTDWSAQGEWMLGTKVTALDPQAGPGQRLEAFTGAGRVGVLDTMTITEWDPPRRCVVDHTGRVVRGEGVFEVDDLGDGRCLIRWAELLDLPGGSAGRLGWVLVRPMFTAGVRVSLERLAAQVERRARQ